MWGIFVLRFEKVQLKKECVNSPKKFYEIDSRPKSDKSPTPLYQEQFTKRRRRKEETFLGAVKMQS
jgi:hypothetical protein